MRGNSLSPVLFPIVECEKLAELLFLGRDYPQGYTFFRQRLHAAFSAQRGLEGSEAIERALARGDFVRREIEAL